MNHVTPVESGSTYVGRELHAAGVAVLFGVMGESNVDMISMMTQRLGVRYIAARHEQGAVSMAEGYARTTGGMGVATVTYGPGAGNTVTALTSAVRHGSALLIVGGHRTSRNGPPQYHDPVAMFEPTGALVMRIDDPAEVPGSIERAFRAIRSQRRPAVVSYADTILEASFTRAEVEACRDEAPAEIRAASLLDLEAIDRFATIFAAAKRPAILAGRGAIAAGASGALVRLSELTGAALLTSLLGHGQLGSSPSAVGICGGLATDDGARVMRDADAVLVVGTALNGWTSDAGRAFANAEILHADTDPQAHERAYVKAQYQLVAEAAEVSGRMVETVADLVQPRRSNGYWWDGTHEDHAAVPMEIGNALDPFVFARAVDEVLPDQRTLVIDGGHFFESICRSIRVPDERGFVWTLGYGSIGLGLASAIGAAIGRPERLAVLGIGDGGLLMSLADLETIPRYDVPLLVLVMNDAAYGAEVKFVEERGWSGEVARFPDTDFAAIARAVGMDAVTVRSEADVRALLPRLRELKSALLVDAKIDQSATAEFMTLLNDLKAPRQ